MKLDIKFEKYSFIYFFIAFFILFLVFILFSLGKKSYSAKVPLDDACTKEAVIEMSKIIYKEFGGDLADEEDNSGDIEDFDYNFYARMATAAVILNNANVDNNNFTSGDTMAERIYNLNNTKYYEHSSYKDKSFDEVVNANKNQIIYISELVLTGKFNFPSNMIFQTNKATIDSLSRAYEWDVVYVVGSHVDTYFGYENSLNNTDIWGRNISNTSKEYFRSLANSFELDDYSSYTLDTVCQNNTTVEKQKHSVYLYTDIEGSEVYKVLEIEDGNTISNLPTPTKEGYIFDGWHYGNGEVFSIDTPITETFNLRAHWTVDSSTDTIPDVDTEPDQTPDDDLDNNYGDNNFNKVENPQTSDKLYLILLVGLFSLIVSMYFYKNKINVVDK